MIRQVDAEGREVGTNPDRNHVRNREWRSTSRKARLPDQLDDTVGRMLRRRRYEDLPDICTPADLQLYLPIGRDAIYAALADGTIPSRRLGQKYIIPRTALRDFLGSVEREDSARTVREETH